MIFSWFSFFEKTQMETVAAKENSQCCQIYFLFFWMAVFGAILIVMAQYGII